MSMLPDQKGFRPIGYAGSMPSCKSRQPGRMLSAALLAAIAVGCVTPPRAVGPTTMAGRVPGAAAGATSGAARAPYATDGPLRWVEAPRFAWTHVSATAATFEWSCTLENPSQDTFQVTVVVRLLDVNGRLVKTSNIGFRIGGKSTMPVNGNGVVEGPEVERVTDWRIEYWPQLSPRPVRE